MGILDDAIREHLELIREHGAADSEVQRLEDEAFGPPTRPDEADFPESEEAPAASANGAAMETAVEERELEDPAVHEDATTLMPTSEASDEPANTGEADAGTGLAGIRIATCLIKLPSSWRPRLARLRQNH